RGLRYGNVAVHPVFVHTHAARFFPAGFVPGPALGGDGDFLDDGRANGARDLRNGLPDHRLDEGLRLCGCNKGAGGVTELKVCIDQQSDGDGITPDVVPVILVCVDRLRAVAQGGVVEQDLIALVGLGEDAELVQPKPFFQPPVHVVSVLNDHREDVVLDNRDRGRCLGYGVDKSLHVNRLYPLRHFAGTDHNAGKRYGLASNQSGNEVSALDCDCSAVVTHVRTSSFSLLLLDTVDWGFHDAVNTAASIDICGIRDLPLNERETILR